MSEFVMPVSDQVRDDGSGIQCFPWIPAFAGMTTLRFIIAGLIVPNFHVI
jgi:hypothetical protein